MWVVYFAVADCDASAAPGPRPRRRALPAADGDGTGQVRRSHRPDRGDVLLRVVRPTSPDRTVAGRARLAAIGRRSPGPAQGGPDVPEVEGEALRGPVRVPSQRAVRQARRAGHPGHRRALDGGGQAGRRGSTADSVVVKAQVKTGGRGKAGGVKLADSPDDAEAKAGDILGLDIKGHVVRRLLITPAADIETEYYVSFLLDRANRTYLAMASVEGGMDIEEVARTKPEALAKMPVDALTGVDEAKAREIVDAARLPRRHRRPGGRRPAEAVARLRRGGRHPGRGQPAGEDARRPDPRARRQGHPRRQRRLPAPRPRGVRRPRRDRPARGGGQGEGPQLRQARRLGRHHRQRCRARHEHARRRRVRRRGVRRRQAGQLPRHRRRRLRGGHGQRPRDHPVRPAGEGGLRQRLRWHHLLRRGRQRHRPGVRDARRAR